MLAGPLDYADLMAVTGSCAGPTVHSEMSTTWGKKAVADHMKTLLSWFWMTKLTNVCGLIWQICIEHLLCARYLASDVKMSKTDTFPNLVELMIKAGSKMLKKNVPTINTVIKNKLKSHKSI